MTNHTAAQVLAKNTIAAQQVLGIDRGTAFDLTIAAMIAEDPDAMRAFLAAAKSQYEKEAAGA
jgi:hypothetical protein